VTTDRDFQEPPPMSDVPAGETSDQEALASPGATADAQEHAVDSRYVSLQRISGWLVTILVSLVSMVGLVIAGLFARPSLVITLSFFALWVVASAALAALSHVWPALEHRHLSYRLSEQSIRIRRGVLWREVITVPRNRIQHTDVSQGPLERRFGLATLLVHTAGTEFARVTLPGLENGRALAIRDHLMAGGEDDAL
jgi:membrane protein YdbS with pleckstrin-like domain